MDPHVPVGSIPVHGLERYITYYRTREHHPQFDSDELKGERRAAANQSVPQDSDEVRDIPVLVCFV